MKSSWKRICAILILFAAVLIFSMLPVTAAMASTQQVCTLNDDSIQIEAKYKKVSTNKIVFNANGGKIGSKKSVATNVKKGAKIKKLPTTPKRSGYTFRGWYTKKSGGKKISVSTKPAKSTTYYARWTKTTSNSKIVGHWLYEEGDFSFLTGNNLWTDIAYKEFAHYYFLANGKFQYFEIGVNSPAKYEGEYSVSSGKAYLKNIKFYRLSDDHIERNIAKFGSDHRKWGWKLIRQSSNVMTTKYKFGSDGDGNYLEIAYPRIDAVPNNIYPGDKFYKIK